MNGRKRVKKIEGAILLAFALLLLLIPQTIFAEGLLEDFSESQMGYLYASYDLENYDLDFYVDSSWSWLPWNWMDAIGRQVMYGLYCLTNGLWWLSRLLSAATGSVVSEAYRFDLVNEMADVLGENMQRLAGVSAAGFSGSGFYPGFIMLVLMVLGVYVMYTGVIKREVSRALGVVVKTVVIFLLTTAIIVYAPLYVRYINEFSSDVSAAALELGTGISMPGAHTGEGDSVDLIRDNLFSIQVYQPWLLLQWGTTDVNEIGEERVHALLSAAPDAEYGTTREALVKEEIETCGNMRMSILKVVTRLGEVAFIFLINLFISIFIIFLCGFLIFSQILFVMYSLFLVISFVLSLFPECGHILKRSLVKVFNVIMLRAGYTLMITVAFTISSMIYSISPNHSFIIIGFLQIVVYAGIFFTKRDILQMMSLQEDTGIRRAQAVGGLLAYHRYRRGTFKRERRKEKVREGFHKLHDVNKEVVGDSVHAMGSRVRDIMDRRKVSWQNESARQRRTRKIAMYRDRDFSAVGRERTPDVSQMKRVMFHRRDKDGDVSAGDVYDRYFFYAEAAQDLYQVAGQIPNVENAEFYTEKYRVAKDRYIRPEKWAKKLDGESIRKTYYKRRFEDKRADVFTEESVGAELREKGLPRRYITSERPTEYRGRGHLDNQKPEKEPVRENVDMGVREKRPPHHYITSEHPAEYRGRGHLEGEYKSRPMQTDNQKPEKEPVRENVDMGIREKTEGAAARGRIGGGKNPVVERKRERRSYDGLRVQERQPSAERDIKESGEEV